MNWKEQYKSFLWIAGFFIFAYFMPIESETFKGAILAAFDLAKWYAQEHVLLCLIPAFFIAGTIAVFVSQAAVVKYFGAKAKKVGCIFSSLSFGNNTCCLFLYSSSFVFKYS